MPRAPRIPRPRRSLLITIVMTAALALPAGVVLASHQFGDVPTSNPFHNDIAALVNSGVTAGCGGGNYCPKSDVTREQMAAFLNRLGALAPDKTPVVNAAKLSGYTAGDLVPGGTVPPGTTIRGNYSADMTAAGADSRTTSAISFGYLLASAPVARFIPSGAALPTGCSGTSSNPGASPGFLCVFESSRSNINTACIARTTGYTCGAADRMGATVFARSSAAGTAYSVGTWAVTAPLAVSAAPDPKPGVPCADAPQC
jgi:hypothetical protein